MRLKLDRLPAWLLPRVCLGKPLLNLHSLKSLRHDDTILELLWLEVPRLACHSDTLIVIVELLGGHVIGDGVLFRLISIFSCESLHFVLFKQVFVDFLSNECLVFVLYKLFELLILWDITFNLWISEIVLLFGNETDPHFVDFELLLESIFAVCEIVLDGLVVLTPCHDLTHCWVQMSQILLFSIQSFMFIELVKYMAQNLMLYLSSFNIGLRSILWQDLLEPFP